MCVVLILGICITCSLYKLAHGVKYFHYSNMFYSWGINWLWKSSHMLFMLFSNITLNGQREMTW